MPVNPWNNVLGEMVQIISSPSIDPLQVQPCCCCQFFIAIYPCLAIYIKDIEVLCRELKADFCLWDLLTLNLFSSPHPKPLCSEKENFICSKADQAVKTYSCEEKLVF